MELLWCAENRPLVHVIRLDHQTIVSYCCSLLEECREALDDEHKVPSFWTVAENVILRKEVQSPAALNNGRKVINKFELLHIVTQNHFNTDQVMGKQQLTKPKWKITLETDGILQKKVVNM